VRRDDLLKPDVMSEVILLGAGALAFVILILILSLSPDESLCAGLKPKPRVPPRSGPRLAGILALASVFGKLAPETFLRVGNPLQSGYRNTKEAATKSADSDYGNRAEPFDHPKITFHQGCRLAVEAWPASSRIDSALVVDFLLNAID
jgi:hypothetical protein